MYDKLTSIDNPLCQLLENVTVTVQGRAALKANGLGGQLVAAVDVIRRHGMLNCDSSLLLDLKNIEDRSLGHFKLKQPTILDFLK